MRDMMKNMNKMGAFGRIIAEWEKQAFFRGVNCPKKNNRKNNLYDLKKKIVLFELKL